MSVQTQKIWQTVKNVVIDFALTFWSVFDWRNDGFSCAGEDTPESKRLWHWLLLAAVITGAVLRGIVFSMEPDLGRDAVLYVDIAESWAAGGWAGVLERMHGFYLPPCMFWWIKIFIQAGMSPLAAAIMVNMAAGIIMIPLFYAIGKVLFASRKAGVIAAFLAAYNPRLVEYSTEVMRENFMLSGLAVMLLFTVLGFRKNSLYFLGSGFFTVYSILSRMEALEVLPLMGACLALLAIFRIYPLKKLLLCAAYFLIGCIAGCIIFYFLFGIPSEFYTGNFFIRGKSALRLIL